MPSSGLNPVDARIYQGQITSIDPSRWVCTVDCRGAKREFTNVTIPSLYSTPFGEGIHYMPEIGARVFVCRPSDGSEAFLLLSAPFASASTEDGQPGSYHSNRPFLNPGDMTVLTRDGNGLIVRRGGVTELRGTALSRIITNPFKNQLLCIAENWKVETLGGSTEWKTLTREEDAFADLSTRKTEEAKEFVTSKSWSVRTQMGSCQGHRIELDGVVPQPPLTPTTKVLQLSDGTAETVTVFQPSAPDPAARVIDLQVRADETQEYFGGLELPTLQVGVSREGAALVETTKKIRIAKSPSLDTSSAEPVVQGTTFLTKLNASMSEIKGILNSLGFPTPQTDLLLGDIVASLSDRSPLLSETLETD